MDMIAVVERAVLAARTAELPIHASTQDLASQVAIAIAIARRLRPPMKFFANEVRREMGWSSLSMRAVYAWERGEARVPAAALLAAANVACVSIDELLFMVRELDRRGLRPGE